eukprot:symbB.v1.2.009951.t1/scaffold559.1/size321893/6
MYTSTFYADIVDDRDALRSFCRSRTTGPSWSNSLILATSCFSRVQPRRPRRPRAAYEPFGGVYAREYALRRGAPLKPEQSWIFFPALALALTLTWQVFHNWTHALIALLITSFLAQCYMPEWEDYGILFGDSLRAPAARHRLASWHLVHLKIAHRIHVWWMFLLKGGRFLVDLIHGD